MASSESLLISSIIRSGDIGPVMDLDPKSLVVHEHQLRWILEAVDAIGHVPDRHAFLAQFPDFALWESADVAAHAHAVRREHDERSILKMSSEVLDLLEGGDLNAAMQLMSTRLLDLQSSLTGVNNTVDVIGQWSEVYDLVEDKVDRVRTHGSAGVPSGWSVIDLNTGGWQAGWLVVIGGRLGQGKTWAMIRSACEAVMCGKTVLYFSLEQSRHQIAMRAQSVLARLLRAPVINSLDMLRGTIDDTSQLRSAMQAVQAGVSGRLLVNDTSRGQIGPMQIAAAVDRIKSDDPDADMVVFIDYLTLLAVPKSVGDWRDVARLSADLKRVAERYAIPVVTGSQVNRSAIGQELPDAGHLSQADSVGQDADVVIALARPALDVLKMGLIKNRHGPDGIHWFTSFRPAVGDLQEITGDEAERRIQKAKELP